MRILFERSGGFTGIRLQRAIDSSDLAPAEARKLESLLRKSHFFELPSHLNSAQPSPDRFLYRVTVQTENESRTIEASESAVPAALRPLLEWLVRFEAR